MMDLIDDPEPGRNAPEYSVTELSGLIKRMIEGEFGHVRIRAEVGRVMWARSGHLYFDLKDDRAVISAVSWKGQAARLTTKPEEGMEVVATGRLTTFAGQSKYQLIVEDLAIAGVGALMAMLEKRKQALAAEGLFAPERKKPLPYLPQVIGVVTSPSGAVIRDILHRLRDRFPRRVLLWPVAVQGAACAPEVVRAVEGFNRLTSDSRVPRPDLLIVARGGGSIEDLWGFNEEAVARAVAASDIPVISAVGHETDTTLIDYVSDQRAPTPTAAAEMAVPRRDELMAALAGLDMRRLRAMADGLARRDQRVRDLARGLPRREDMLAQASQRFDLLAARLPRALLAVGDRAGRRLTEHSARLRPDVLTRALAARKDRVEALSKRLDQAGRTRLAQAGQSLAAQSDRVRPALVARRLTDADNRLARTQEAFARVAMASVTRCGDRLDALDRLRLSLGYQATLARGYAVVRSGSGDVLPTVASARKAGALEIEFHDGRLGAAVGSVAAPTRPAQKSPGTKPDQGELF